MQRMQRKQKWPQLRLNQRLTKKKQRPFLNKSKKKAASFLTKNLTPLKNKSSFLHHRTPHSACAFPAQAEQSRRSAPSPSRRFYCLKTVPPEVRCRPLPQHEATVRS